MTVTDMPCTRREGSVWSECPCEPCLRSNRWQAKLRRAGKPLPPRRSAQAWNVLDAMLAAGWQPAGIAAASGVGLQTIHGNIRARRNGTTRQWSRANAEKLIAAAGRMDNVTVGRHSAAGARRRLRALAAVGWGLDSLVEAMVQRGYAPISEFTLYAIRTDTTRVTPASARWVKDAYDELWDATPPREAAATLARANAARRGWAPPAAWDDDQIDDPDAEPNQSMRVDLDEVKAEKCARGKIPAGELTARERETAVRILHREGLSDPVIAARMETTDRTVFRIRKRLGLPANVDNIGVNHGMAG